LFDEGASAYFERIMKYVDDSMKSDLDHLRIGLGPDFNALDQRMMRDFEKFHPEFEDLKFPRGPDFNSRLPTMPHILTEPASSFFDVDDVMKLPPLPEVDPSAGGESITRRLLITEVDGKFEEWEAVTRCRDGKCITEVIRDGDGQASERLGDTVAPPKRFASFESISRVFHSENEEQQQRQQQQQQDFGEKSQATQEPIDEVQSKTQGGEVVDPSKPNVHSQSVTRTIISRDVDGKREEVEVIERCQNGKCEREVRRSGGVNSENKTLEQAA